MTKYEMLESLTKNQGGYLLTSEVQEVGISRTYLMKFVREQNMEKVEPGIYVLPEIWMDPFYVLQIKNKGIIYSHETALYLHGLMEKEPSKICVCVKRGYNASHLIKRGIKPYYVKKELFEEGAISVETLYGNKVLAYDIDRTICDIVRRKDEMDVQVFQYAIKNYMNGQKKNLHQLAKYAKLLGVEQKIRNYTEVLL